MMCKKRNESILLKWNVKHCVAWEWHCVLWHIRQTRHSTNSAFDKLGTWQTRHLANSALLITPALLRMMSPVLASWINLSKDIFDNIQIYLIKIYLINQNFWLITILANHLTLLTNGLWKWNGRKIRSFKLKSHQS